MTSGSTEPEFPFSVSFGLLAVLLFSYDLLCKRIFDKIIDKDSTLYFHSEKTLTLFALIFYGLALFSCNIHYYLSPLSFSEKFPAFVSVSGLFFFLFFLIIMWRRAQPAYESIFTSHYNRFAFLLFNIKTNLPIILPWIVLSLAYDLLALLPIPGLTVFIHSKSGEYISFALFLLLILIFFPPIVRRLWGCTPFPVGALLTHLQDFFKKQHFSARIFLWPLFEGRVITAGVMGIIPGLRYVMITPALLEHLSLDELDAVMAHEIGHIKKKHMLLYLLIISGFSVLAGFILEPFTFFLLSRESYYTLLRFTGITAENLLTLLMAVVVLLLMIFYFRFVFGYFIRNFERQADLHVFDAIGSSKSIIAAFEKIAVLSGNIRDIPSWHHFGIGQRVDYLEKCEADSLWISRHNRKIRCSLLAYIFFLGVAVFGQSLLPSEAWKVRYEEKYTEYVLDQKLIKEPDKALWLGIAGDLMQHKKMEKKAIAAYNKALALEPSNPKLLNNLAWLLLTSDDLTLRDPGRALEMARLAGMQVPAGHILDTLATAYWANGFVKKAIEKEREAMFVDPAEGNYYSGQIRKFRKQEYED